jgi:hypothetical protein
MAISSEIGNGCPRTNGPNDDLAKETSVGLE